MNNIKYYENSALSNQDILNLLNGKCNIVLYPDMHKYKTIEQLLNPYNCCIILYESKPNYGHWCALTKHNDNIEFMNSYGGLPDCCLKYINKDFRKKSKQLIPYLKKLMFKSPYALFYNEFAFQKKGYDIKTCGRHCVIRCLCKDLNIYQYKNLLDELCKMWDTDYDGVVTILTE